MVSIVTLRVKATYVSIQPTEAATLAQRPALTPELLAASGARYSRSNEGLEGILSRIDPANLDRSVDSIFRMIDYGHQSIADMAPIAIFLDGVSIWLAYYVWSLCPTAGGQESSTRYIRLSPEGLIDPELLGIDPAAQEEWRASMADAFHAYEKALAFWEKAAAASPELVRIPENVMNDPSEKAAKQRARMQRNYAFDRARNFIPSATATNMMLVMSARGWVNLCQHLLSHFMPEAVRLGTLIREELALGAPRLLKHAVRQENIALGLDDEFQELRGLEAEGDLPTITLESFTAEPRAILDLMEAPGATPEDVAHALRFHEHRYGWIGQTLRRTGIRFAWDAVGFAEIRDLNRHRTGTKYCPTVPVGFYAALDVLPSLESLQAEEEEYKKLALVGANASKRAREILAAGSPAYAYYTLLGTQFPFEHTTTADKFLYEAELRTGAGAHYRYAQHLHDALVLWYQRFPETRGAVIEGGAEPE